MANRFLLPLQFIYCTSKVPGMSYVHQVSCILTNRGGCFDVPESVAVLFFNPARCRCFDVDCSSPTKPVCNNVWLRLIAHGVSWERCLTSYVPTGYTYDTYHRNNQQNTYLTRYVYTYECCFFGYRSPDRNDGVAQKPVQDWYHLSQVREKKIRRTPESFSVQSCARPTWLVACIAWTRSL